MIIDSPPGQFAPTVGLARACHEMGTNATLECLAGSETALICRYTGFPLASTGRDARHRKPLADGERSE
jgi:hypothetical protein